MRIGIDIDDTICYSIENMLPYICKFYDFDYDEEKSKCLAYDDYHVLPNYFEFAKQNYDIAMPYARLKEGADRYINLMSELGHEIIFITARGGIGFSNPYEISKEYLEKYNIHYDKLIIGAENKGEVCKNEKIDIFIDDNIRNCFCVEDNDIEVLLFDNIFNKEDSHFKRVENWEEIYDIIQKKST